MLTTGKNDARPHKLPPTSLTFDSKMFGFTQELSPPQTPHINLNF